MPDALTEIMTQASLGDPETLETLREWLLQQFLESQYAAMVQAGRAADEQVPLSRVFVDLEVSTTQDNRANAATFVASMLTRSTSADQHPAYDGHLLLGGPGQGKSTLGQFLAQLYRVQLLAPFRDRLTPTQQSALREFQVDQQRLALTAPAVARVPIRIELRELAAWLADRDPDASRLEDYIADDAQRFASVSLPPTSFLKLAAHAPLLVVLDGVDEVPPNAPRAALQRVVERFLLSVGNAGTQVLVTSRPQGHDGEFARFRTWTLQEVSEEIARRYAQGLGALWFPDRSRERERLSQKIDDTLKRPDAASLLSSPLQITIIALLLTREGELPTTRWALFQNYYEVIYTREVERNTFASRILADHRPQILAVHRHAGLYLHAQAERAPDTACALDEARLLNFIVHEFVEERGESAETVEPLARELLRACSERLVLLSQRTSGRYSFEVRSLQEFMAAGALMALGEGDTHARLVAIAASSHWRNVLLFAVGSVFAGTSTKQSRRRHSVELCDALDARRPELLAWALTPGSELARDLLLDTAVLQDRGCAQALIARMQPHLVPPHRGTAPILVPLLKRLRQHGFSQEAETIEASMIAMASSQDPAVLGCTWAALGMCLIADEDSSLRQRACALWEAYALRDQLRVLDLVWPHYRVHDLVYLVFGPLVLTAHHRIKITLPVPWDGTYSLHGIAAVDGADVSALDIFDDDRHSELTGLIEFLRTPSAVTLSRALRSEVWSWESPRRALRRLPWPLMSCLEVSSTSSDLERLAVAAENGLLGDTEAWRRAEIRWGREQISVDDLFAPVTSDLPFDAGIANYGMPDFLPSGSAYSVRAVHEKIVVEWIDRCRSIPAGPRRRMIARCLSVALEHMTSLGVDARLCLAEIDPSGAVLSLLMGRAEDLREEHFGRLGVIAGDIPLGGIWRCREEAITVLAEGWFLDRTQEHLLVLIAAATNPGSLTVLRGAIDLAELHTARGLIAGMMLLEHLGALDATTLAPSLARLTSLGPDENDLEALMSRWPEEPAFRPAHLALLAALRDTPNLLDHPRLDLAREQMLAEVRRAPSGLSARATWDALNLPPPCPFDVPHAAASASLSSVLQPSHGAVIESFSLKNLRVFSSLTAGFRSPSGAGQWILILGENSTGKTTLLRALALCLASPEVAGELLRLLPAPLRRHQTPIGSASVTVDGRSFGVVFNGEARHETLRVDEAVTAVADDARPWVVGYGCRRGSALGGPERDVRFGERDQLATLFDGDDRLVHAESWLLRQKLAALQNPGGPAEQRYQTIQRVLCGDPAGTGLLPGVHSVDVAKDDNRVWIEGPSIGRTLLAGLSDGYVTTAGWTIDLLARWVEREAALGRQVGDGFNETMTGLVLIDEIDLHLHPAWQLQVIESTRRFFPRLSFVATTHNPVTLAGAREGEVHRLLRDEDASISLRPVQFGPGQRFDQVLTGLSFGLPSAIRDRDTRELLDRHINMLARGVPPEDEARRATEQLLRERLGGYLDTSLERMVASIAAEQLAREQRIPLSADERARFRERVVELLRAKRD